MSKLSNLFDVFYSTEIPEAYKDIIADTIISESNPEELYTSLVESADSNEALVDAVDLLAHTASTERDLMEAIDIVFENFDTETINDVTEAFKERAVRSVLLEREEALNELFGFGKSEERKGAENILRVSSNDVKKAQAALKRAQDKVKGNKNPIGLAGLDKGVKSEKALKRAQTQLNKALAAEKQSKAELGELKQRERKESIDKLKGAAKSVWGKFKEGVKAAANKVKDTAVAAKNKTIEAAGKAKEGAKKGIASAARGIASGATKVANKLDPQVEEPKVKTETPSERANKHLAAAKVPVPEALIPAIELISSTSISEAALDEIIEMIVNPAAVELKKKKDEVTFNKILSSINADLVTGKKAAPEKVEAAEKIADRVTKFANWYKKGANSSK